MSSAFIAPTHCRVSITSLSSSTASGDAYMATTEPLNASDRIEKAEGVNGVEEGFSAGAVKSEGSSAKAEESSSTPSATKPASPTKDVSPARQDQASGTASTRSTPVNGSAPTPSLSMPHPKKFSHIDINKRFLEKNSAASSTGHAASPSIANKSSSTLRMSHVSHTQ